MSQLGMTPMNPHCFFCPNLGFLVVVFLPCRRWAGGRWAREGGRGLGSEPPPAHGAIPRRVNGCPPSVTMPEAPPVLPSTQAESKGSGGRSGGISHSLSQPLAGLRLAFKVFVRPIPQKFLGPPGVISSGIQGEEREVLARGRCG